MQTEICRTLYSYQKLFCLQLSLIAGVLLVLQWLLDITSEIPSVSFFSVALVHRVGKLRQLWSHVLFVCCQALKQIRRAEKKGNEVCWSQLILPLTVTFWLVKYIKAFSVTKPNNWYAELVMKLVIVGVCQMLIRGLWCHLCLQQTVTEEKFSILFQSQFSVGGGELVFQVWVSLITLYWRLLARRTSFIDSFCQF